MHACRTLQFLQKMLPSFGGRELMAIMTKHKRIAIPRANSCALCNMLPLAYNMLVGTARFLKVHYSASSKLSQAVFA